MYVIKDLIVTCADKVLSNAISICNCAIFNCNINMAEKQTFLIL